ncbi:Zinc/iron permease [Gracilaria domingensis]|nr:Zinc/iron permease [Gracilaria domingensis]
MTSSRAFTALRSLPSLRLTALLFSLLLLYVSATAHKHSHSHSHAHSHTHPHAHPHTADDHLSTSHCSHTNDAHHDQSLHTDKCQFTEPHTSLLPDLLLTSLRRSLQPLHDLPPETAAFTASLLASSVSLVSVILLPFSASLSKVLLPFAAGALLSDLCNHLLPHLYADSAPIAPLLLGVALFALLDSVLQRFSAHDHDHNASSTESMTPDAHHVSDRQSRKDAYINLAADALHNFCDGLSIAAAFLVSSSMGIVTTMAVILHEIPQELADFAVLLRAGFSRPFALFANVVCACTALLGTLVALRLRSFAEDADKYILPFAAGALMYMTFCTVLPHVVLDISRPGHLDGKQVQVSFLQFCFRAIFALGLAGTGVFVVSLVEQAHEH